MFGNHTSDQLAAWLDGELPGAVRARVETHLAQCERCRTELGQVETAKAALQFLPLASAPEGLWSAIEQAVDSQPKPRLFLPAMWRYAAAMLLIAVAVGIYRTSSPPAGEWEVLSLAGSPRAGKKQLSARQTVRTGQWVETGTSSRARILIGQIGSVDLDPKTAVRLVSTGKSGHRLALESGGITARISAPPRLFFVDTPSATAVDLGCEYHLECDRDGTGLLRVMSGWVALEWRGRESLVPAGASCRTHPGQGPGTPWFDDAPSRLVQALEDFDLGAGPQAIALILDQARTRDTLTLWHMLPRATSADRPRIYDRMATLAPPPSGVTREAVLNLEPDSLERWKNELAWIW